MKNKRLSLAAFEPDIPQNVGALIRLSVGMDITLHVIEPCGFVWDERKIKQSAMDYRGKAELIRHKNWAEFLNSTRPRRLVLLTTKTENSLYDFEFKEDDILLLGRESAGVPDHVHNGVTAHVKIPMPGEVRSFNVAMSGAIAVAEALRQLNQF